MQSDCRFRTTNHYLPIETGRWRENRYCNLCNCQKLGDEYHYVLECSSLNDKRKQLLPKYYMKRHNEEAASAQRREIKNNPRQNDTNLISTDIHLDKVRKRS